MEPEYAIDPSEITGSYWQGSRTAIYNLRAFPKLSLLTGAALWLPVFAVLTGCGSKRSAQVQVPQAPEISASESSASPAASENDSETQEPRIARSSKVIYVETGMASWYGPS